MNKTELNNLKIGDMIIYSPSENTPKISYLTIGKSYRIERFYDNKYGAVISDDTSIHWKICNSNLKECFIIDNTEDRVCHPSHYTWLKDICGIEVIDITRHMNFNLGNCIKYLLRAGHKKEVGLSIKEKTIEDLEKAKFYIEDEIKRLKNKEN